MQPLRFDQGVTLIGGGEVGENDLALARHFAPGLVAADGGAAHALRFGAMPDAVIGDFDSLSPEIKMQIRPERLVPVAEQDSTDFEKCLTRICAPYVIGVGFLGGRQDHGLAALAVIARIVLPPVILLGENDLIFAAPPELALDLGAGTRVSLFPMGAAHGRSTGLRWPVDGIAFSPDGRIGTSNITTGPLRLSMTGPMLVILPKCCLATVMTQHFAAMTG